MSKQNKDVTHAIFLGMTLLTLVAAVMLIFACPELPLLGVKVCVVLAAVFCLVSFLTLDAGS